MIEPTSLSFNLRLSGTDRVDVPDISGGRTLASWTRVLEFAPVPLSTIDAVERFLWYENTTTSKLSISVRTGTLLVAYKRASDTGLLTTTAPVARCVLCVTYTTGTIRVYINGVQVASATDAAALSNDSAAFSIGHTTNTLPAQIFSARKYARALAVTELTALPTDYISYWPFTDGADAVVVDLGSLTNNGSIVGVPDWHVNEHTGFINSHINNSLELLLAQFHSKPNLEKLLRALSTSVQELERTFHEVLSLSYLDFATGSSLTGLGDEVGEIRDGRSDSDYRVAIKARQVINTGGGQPELLIGIIDSLFPQASVKYLELYPANVHIYAAGLSIPSRVFEAIASAVPAGVQLALVRGVSPFVFEGDLDGSGFSEVNMTVEGYFSEVYQQ